MSFYGAPKLQRPTLPKRGNKLPKPVRHSTKLWFRTHDAAVAFCKSQKQHHKINVVMRLIEDKLVKYFMVEL